MKFKEDLIKDLEENDVFLSLSHFQRLTIAEIAEKILPLHYVVRQSEQLCDHIYFDNTQKPDNCIYCNHKREPNS